MTLNNSTKRFKIGKLIRDKLADEIRSKGIVVEECALSDGEFIQKLGEKLSEEASEVANAHTKEALAEELADVLEVVYTLAETSQISLEEIQRIRQNKRATRGGFDGRIYTPWVEMPEDHPAADYYRSRADQYPEMALCPSCIFCQICNGQKEVEVLARFKHCLAIKDLHAVSKGHILIIPFRHTSNWFTASEAERLDIMQAIDQMKKKLDATYQPDGYNIGVNCGELAGQTVMHLHVHLIPRYKDDMPDPKGGVRGVIPEKQKYHHD